MLWLAAHGWTATGIDISATAIDRARASARDAGLEEDRARFVVGDLSRLPGFEHYDLVTASFLHSPVALPRIDILRAAAGRVAPGGHLLVTSHAAPPPWSAHAHHTRFLTPDEEIAQLALDPNAWQTLLAETRRRDTVGPDGTPAILEDAIVLLRHSRST